MSDEKISELFNRAFKSVPHCEGVSNHMGSKATEDRRVMSLVFDELKKKDLYFVDSLVTPKTICMEVAEGLDLRFIKRDIFIDNEPNSDYIRNQLRKTVIAAKKKGYVVAIAHDRPDSLKIIKNAIPELEQEGIRFVFVSELINELNTRN
jgi:hypothetical protein